MKTLSIDIETYSGTELKNAGVYRYCEDPDFTILLFGYAADGGAVEVIDLTSGASIPRDVIRALYDPAVTKWAFNAQFERVCLSRYLSVWLSPVGWRCSMVWSGTLGLPMSLAGAGAALGLEKQKLSEGQDLIRYFCKPCRPTKANGGRTRNRPHDAPDKWAEFLSYNRRDVEVEMNIQRSLKRYPVPESEWRNYELDQQINDRGVALDMELVQSAIRCDAETRAHTMDAARTLTGIDNPNSTQQLLTWLRENGVDTASLDKKAVARLLSDHSGIVRKVLEYRRELAKSSVKKYTAMEQVVCSDGRAHGLIQFYGAQRTGRYSGRLIQVQNLPQNHISDLELARKLVTERRFLDVELLFDSVPSVLSELIRTAFVPKSGCVFHVADFSAIEARVIAWLAGEDWRMRVFESGGDIYCASASRMFRVPVEKHGQNAHLRQKGKVAELACIAEGSLVLTDHGLVPIERVTRQMRLWDGCEWVHHQGVVSRGEKEVIEYEGLCATPDHIVWIEGHEEPIQLGIAAASGSHLLQTGEGRRPLRVGHDYKPGNAVHKRLAKARVYDIRNAGPRNRFTVSGRLVHNCGYGGSVGALKAMGALELGVPESDLSSLITDWRSANPRIVQFWWNVDAAVKKAVKERRTTGVGNLRFSCQDDYLFIRLPSDRRLAYREPAIGENRFGGESVTYMGVGESKRWTRLESYGPKFVENIVQAAARDLLTEAMQRLTAAGYDIVMHVHDEVVIEAPSETSLDRICTLMGENPPWASGLPLRADGYTCGFYKKE